MGMTRWDRHHGVGATGSAVPADPGSRASI